MTDTKKMLSKCIEETQKSTELFQILDKVYEDTYNMGEKEKNNIILIILLNCDTDEKRQKMIDILKEWKLASSDMIRASLLIREGKAPEVKAKS